MNMNQFTQKSIEALRNMQSIALENENQQIEQIHLLDALVRSKRFLHVRSLGVRLNLTVWFILTLMVQIWRYNNKQRLAKTGEPPFLFVTVTGQLSDAVFFNDIVHILIASAREIDKHRALAHRLCQLHIAKLLGFFEKYFGIGSKTIWTNRRNYGR